MSKWHINKKGVAAPCKATKGICPLGGEEQHFDTQEQAESFANKMFSEEYGIIHTKEKMSVERKKDLAELIRRISGTKSAGFKHECYAALSIAEDMGLDRIAITDENGLTVNITSSDDPKEPVNVSVFVDKSVESVRKYYERMGITIKNKEALARVVYHSDDPNKEILVQSGGPNVLDAAIIKADEVVDIIEVKELGAGAQMPNTTLSTNDDGSISEKSLKGMPEKLKNALKEMKVQDSDGTDTPLNFGSPEENKKAALEYFIDKYKEKGATAFIYTTNNGEIVNKVDLTGDKDVVLQRLLDHKIEAKLTMRANANARNVTEGDIYRFNSILSKQYFKSGRPSASETFTLKGIKPEKIKKAGDFVRIGGYIIPSIRYDEYQDNLTKRIKKTEMKAFKPVLTGSIKTNY